MIYALRNHQRERLLLVCIYNWVVLYSVYYLNISSRIEPVQLVDELQHGSLDLVVSSGSIIKP